MLRFSEYFSIDELDANTISITDEPCIIRIISQSCTGRDYTFRTLVRERDGMKWHR
ncbi:hypothetical protein V1524DRAFT_431737 [Lipomyces starkeyi]